MNVLTFFREYDRMCRYYRFENDCTDCPLARFIQDRDGTCLELCKKYPEESVEFVENWAKEHPAKTYKSVFLEAFPNATTNTNGIPDTCVIGVFGKSRRPDGCDDIGCSACWNREVEECLIS